MDINHSSESKYVKFRFVIMSVFVFIVLNVISLNTANAQETDIIYACDTCDYSKAYWIAEQNVPSPSCSLTNAPGVPATPDDMYCASEFRTFIVANPVTEQAFKFNAHIPCANGLCNYLSPSVINIPLGISEQNELQVFYDIDRDLRAAVASLSSSQSNTQSVISIASTTNEQEVMITSGLDEGDCVGSPVQYFTNIAWRNQLKDTLASDLSFQVNGRTFSAFTTSTALNGFSIGPNQIGVSFQYNEGQLYTRYSMGGDEQNSLHFRIEYRGNIFSGGVNSIDLEFVLELGTSKIEGVRLSDFMGAGHIDLGGFGDIGCLSMLLNNPEFTDVISEGQPEWIPVDPFNPSSPTMERCYKTVTGVGCIVDKDGSRQCRSTTIGFWEMCSSNFP